MTVKPKALVFTVLLGTLIVPALSAATARQTPSNQAASNQAHAGSGDHGHPGGGVITDVRFLTRYLTLTSTQVTQLQTLLQTLRTAEQTAHDAAAPLYQQLHTDVNAASPDPATVGRDYLALVDSREQIQAAIKAFEASFEAILTADQLTKFQALIQGAASDETDALPGCPPASTTS
ncbi:MAG TPA: hypothetical protein VGS07_07415 [Thermoanaerobaculia bacterium]|nr:hypothetical protein [Thermoanaerobaculia bacterium]